MLKYIFWIFAIYFLYRFIFDFLLPVSKTTSQLRQKIKDFNQQQSNAQSDYQQQSNTAETSAPRHKEGEYIDFEEVK